MSKAKRAAPREGSPLQKTTTGFSRSTSEIAASTALPVEAAILRGMGVVAGVPDIIAIRDGRVFALELKVEGSRTTDKQLVCIAALREAGAFTAVAGGLDRALAVLESWGLLRGRVS